MRKHVAAAALAAVVLSAAACGSKASDDSAAETDAETAAAPEADPDDMTIEEAGDTALIGMDLDEFCSDYQKPGYDVGWSEGFDGAAEPYGFSDQEVFDEVASRCPVTEAPSTTTTTEAPPTTTAAPPPTTTTTEAPSETAGQSNARQKAAEYLDFTSFSRSGLIDQLKYEGFSEADATYGVDAQNADWNEQAAKKAAEYLDFTSFSHGGLVDQLVYEGFTPEQAEYGVSTTGL
jgi:hypothetical protein